MIHPRKALAGRSDHKHRTERVRPDLLAPVLEALPLGIGLFEIEDDMVVYRAGNREFARVLRLEHVPVSGAPLGDIFTKGDGAAVSDLLWRVQQRAEPQSYFTGAGRTSNAAATWNIDAYPVFSGGRVSHVMVLAEQSEERLDVRQRQEHEANRLREKADQLAELEKVKSEFLRLASHELRGPAAMLGGYLSMMEDDALGPIPERLRPVIPVLRTKAAQINMLANEMVEAARLEDRRLQLKRKRVDLRELVRRSLKSAEAGLTPEHRLRLHDPPSGPIAVLADTMRLEIIISNLIDNAIKYSPDGGEITVELSTAGGLALLTVGDFGIGIAAQDMDRLFVRFYRIAPRPDVPGTGLGLYLARELARLHGGDIVAASKLGEGSEFTLSLPLDTNKK